MKCKICGEIIEHNKEPYLIRNFIQHIKNKHKISKEEYIVKYELNGIHPTCACGCGNFVGINKGWNKWYKYYKNHKNRMPVSEETGKKITKAAKLRRESGYYDDIMTDKEIIDSFNDFLGGQMTLSEISKKYNHDKRTIKRVWINQNKINEIEYEKIAYRNGFSKMSCTKFEKAKQNLDFYEEVYDFILNNKNKYTINEINKIFGQKMTQTTLLKHLKKLFGNDVISYLVYGNKSNEELFFLDILSFYFGKSNVKYGFNVGGKIFDTLVFGKVLIEYDSDFFHSSEKAIKNDMEKNKIAMDNGYILMRVDEKSTRDINLLNKIKECANIN